MKFVSPTVAAVIGLLLLSLSTAVLARSAYPLELADTSAATTEMNITDSYSHTSQTGDYLMKNREWRTMQVFEGQGNAVTPSFVVFGTSWSLGWEIESEPGLNITFRIHIFRSDKPYALWQTISVTSGGEGEKILPIESENGEEFFLKVFTSPLIRWTIRVQDNFPEVPRSVVEISHIHYKGTRYLRDTENCICYEVVEPDEYVAITNSGERAQKMGGWTLTNITKGYPTFTFPTDFVLYPNQTVLVTTNEVYPGCGAWLQFGTRSHYCAKQLWFSFYFGPGDIWDNRTPNTAVLYDSNGREVSRKSYTVVGD